MDTSLYEKYGGFSTLYKLVEHFYELLLVSDIVAPYFEKTNMEALISHQANFIASLMGGPAYYSDSQLKTAHQHMAITDEAWQIVVNHLQQALTDFAVEPADITTLLTIIESKKSLIVKQ